MEEPRGPGRPDRRTDVQEDMAAVVLGRADLLPEPDRALLVALFGRGQTAQQVGAMTGHDPRFIRRRARSLAARVLEPRFVYVAGHRHRWPGLRRGVATSCILHGRSIRQAARELGTTVYNVRRHLNAIDALFDATRA